MRAALNILIVDDDEVDRKMIRRLLDQTSLDYVVQEAASVAKSLRLLELARFDCVLLDYRLPEMNGIDFLHRLRSGGETASPAVVMTSGSGNERLVVQAMRLGVQDYLVKADLTASALEEAIVHAVEENRKRRLAEAKSRRLEEMALVDPLTGAGNRNLFHMRLTHALSRAARLGDPIGLLYLDLNRFKEINDTLGHAAGDEVLQEVSRRLTVLARDSDTVVRLGGDEFAVIMETGVSAEGIACFAQRIGDTLSLPIATSGQTVAVGVSVGAAHYPADAEDADGLIRAADIAMYEAKFGYRPDWDIKLRRPVV